MKDIIANWNDLADDMIADGIKIENVVVIIANQFRVAHGLLTKALVEVGKIPTDTAVLTMDQAAFVE